MIGSQLSPGKSRVKRDARLQEHRRHFGLPRAHYLCSKISVRLAGRSYCAFPGLCHQARNETIRDLQEFSSINNSDVFDFGSVLSLVDSIRSGSFDLHFSNTWSAQSYYSSHHLHTFKCFLTYDWKIVNRLSLWLLTTIAKWRPVIYCVSVIYVNQFSLVIALLW
jgi:hypothetical protein